MTHDGAAGSAGDATADTRPAVRVAVSPEQHYN